MHAHSPHSHTTTHALPRPCAQPMFAVCRGGALPTTELPRCLPLPKRIAAQGTAQSRVRGGDVPPGAYLGVVVGVGDLGLGVKPELLADAAERELHVRLPACANSNQQPATSNKAGRCQIASSAHIPADSPGTTQSARSSGPEQRGRLGRHGAPQRSASPGGSAGSKGPEEAPRRARTADVDLAKEDVLEREGLPGGAREGQRHAGV